MSAHGSVLIMTMAIIILLVSVVGGFLFAAGTFTVHAGWEEMDAKLLWLTEAGLQKAIWNLKTPSGSGGQGETWTTAGVTETLGDGSYTMVVAQYDFALAANGATVSATSSNGSQTPTKATDGDDTTYWESGGNPSSSSPEELIITFPYTLTLNKVRFLVPSGSSGNRPKDYTWQVSADGSSYTTVATITGNTSDDVTDTFVAAANAKYLKLSVTKNKSGGQNTRVATLETIGSKITATGTMTTGGNTYTRTVVQTVVADDGSPENQKAYNEPDWTES